MTTTNANPRFLIVSQTSDKTAAADLAEAIVDCGGEAVWNFDHLSVAEWRVNFEREVERAAAVILLWSPLAKQCDWFKKEAKFAKNRSPTINLRIDGTKPALEHRFAPTFDLTHPLSVTAAHLVDRLSSRSQTSEAALLERASTPRLNRTMAIVISMVAAVCITAITYVYLDDRAWANASDADTIEAMDQYLSNWPVGAHRTAAQRRKIALGVQTVDFLIFGELDNDASNQAEAQNPPWEEITEEDWSQQDPTALLRIGAKTGGISHIAAAARNGDAKATLLLGYATQLAAHKVKLNLPGAQTLFEIACDAGLPRSCSALGALLVNPSYKNYDVERGRSLLREACALGLEQSCYHAIYTLALTTDKERRDTQSAIELGKSQCQDGSLLSCIGLAAVYSFRLDDEPRDYEAALKIFRSACRQNRMQACANIAYLSWYRRGLARDEGLILNNYLKSCHAGNAQSCANVAVTYKNIPAMRNLKKASEYAFEACWFGSAHGCATYGDALLTGRGVKRNRKEALTYLTTACEQRQDYGCRRLGDAHRYGQGTPKNPKQAMQYYKKACEIESKEFALGEKYGCSIYGDALLQGLDGAADVKAAITPLKTACDSGAGPACFHLGLAYRDGEGVEQDTDKAIALLNRCIELDATVGATMLKNAKEALSALSEQTSSEGENL